MFEKRGGFAKKMVLGNCTVELIEIERGSTRGVAKEEVTECLRLRVNGIEQFSATREEATELLMALVDALGEHFTPTT